MSVFHAWKTVYLRHLSRLGLCDGTDEAGGEKEDFSFWMWCKRQIIKKKYVKKTQVHLPGHLKTSSTFGPTRHTAVWEYAAVVPSLLKELQLQGNSWAPMGTRGEPRKLWACVCECVWVRENEGETVMSYYVHCSSSLWPTSLTCSAKFSLCPNSVAQSDFNHQVAKMFACIKKN